jgi:flagellar protein FlaG
MRRCSALVFNLATDCWQLFCYTAIFEVTMSNSAQPSIQLTNSPDYRESYANSVQVRVNVWDFFLVFGTLQQQDEIRVDVRNFQGIYLSPQQAKALYTILQQNLVNYENTFGEIKLDPRMGPGTGPVH